MKKILLLLLLAVAPLCAAVRAVVFDFGGVMAGSTDRSKLVRFLRQSFHLSEGEFALLDLKARWTTPSGMTDGEFWRTLAKERGVQLPDTWSQQLATVIRDALALNIDMYALVSQLHDRGLVVALLSNVDSRHARVTRALGLYNSFDPCLLSCDIGASKPDPKAYEILLRRLHLPPEEVLFIDDKQANVDQARALGIDAIVFLLSDQIRTELKKRSLL